MTYSNSLYKWHICSPRLEDSSEQVKKELARIVGHLSCIQSELSHLSVTHTESTCLHKILCLCLSLATEHAGNTFSSLRASVIRPFLPLLRQQAPSSVKQGIWGFLVCTSIINVYDIQTAEK